MYIDTRVASFTAAPGDPYRPTSTPIYQTATFEQESALAFGEYDYSRSGNPTRTVLEQHLASLEGGSIGMAFSSGVGALSALLRSTFTPDAKGAGGSHGAQAGHLIIGDDLYGGTTRLIERLVTPLGVHVQSVDTTDLEAIERALDRCARSAHSGPCLVLLETPSNPLLRISDIRALSRLAHTAGAKLAVDNTALSPYLQNPLELGADIVVHSATKHLGGHGDVTAGALITNDEAMGEAIGFLRNAEGSGLAPFDSWLLLRGMKTLGVRVAQESRSALEIARFLEQSLGEGAVHYPGLHSAKGHELQRSQARGFGQLISFRTGDAKVSQGICEVAQLFAIAVSFGSTNSTISMPYSMSHASVSDEAVAAGRATPPPADLVRLSIGLEDPRDLIADLGAALASKVCGTV
jgi:cystathionine beta-lyase